MLNQLKESRDGMNGTIWIQLFVFILVVILSIFFYVRIKKNRDLNIRFASLTVEELEKRAKRMAQDHTISIKPNVLKWPISRMNDNYSVILSLYKSLNADINLKRSIPPAAEWLLDNFYVIEEQVKGVSKALRKKNYYNLPFLKKGPFKGYTRVFAIAIEFISEVDGQVEEGTFQKYIEAYQSHSVLFDREIRVLPIMMRIALIEHVRMICEKIKDTQMEWNKADKIIDKYWSDDVKDLDKLLVQFKSIINKENYVNPSFVEHLFYRLRRSGRSYSAVLREIDEVLDKFGMTTELIGQKEHNAQAVSTVSFGNCIMSLKYVSSLNWRSFFESVSHIEQILQKDPDGTYLLMDDVSRGYYLRKIESLAKKYNVSEIHIAKETLDLAKGAFQNGNSENECPNIYNRKKHVGYYLLDEGIDQLESIQNQGGNLFRTILNKVAKHPGKLYAGAIVFLVLVLLAFSIWYGLASSSDTSILMILIVSLVLLIPASEISMSLVNWLTTLIVRPAVFPKLEFKDGIPKAHSTMVVVPTLLNNEMRVVELLKNLENHYLSNPDENLYFALIGAFKDSKGPNTGDDNKILLKAEAGIEALNKRYAKGREALFYFYHRLSVHNPIDNKWTGWERKRGALMEFNELLLGATDTSFSEYSENIRPSSKIQYIITLDADTILPLGMAKKMIGTMAHPLNRPVIDSIKGIVTKGYGLIQPRISFDVESANRSLFSRIVTGQEGMDPYASAISNVYQDLFGEGVFTGKGIYDLRVFHQVLKDVVPENVVLSHDLLEGSYARVGLVSELELVDAYPSKYNGYITRLHRWIRGDWQLIPWLKKTITNKNLQKVSNPLSKISRWKIGDNLRRSLVAPSISLLIIGGFSFLPGNALVWTGFGIVAMGLPFLIHVYSQLISKVPLFKRVKRHMSGFFGIKSSLFQLMLTIIFLPYHSLIAIHAISITLFRVLFSKKKMLEWVTSDDAERYQVNTLINYYRKMGLSSVFGLLTLGLSYLIKPENLILSLALLATWLTSPMIAFYISRDQDKKALYLEQDKNIELRKIARKTWGYFKTFANEKNNWLAPDNYQEAPSRGTAFRTSPTNIGLGLMATLSARDMGYLGSIQTVEKIEKTISTLEKMEKWHGHLYNWYDTRSLEPLKPRYVSTVDSGNLVGYLITLEQGLKGLLNQEIIDNGNLSGMEDTLRCAFDFEAKESFEGLGFEFDLSKEKMTLDVWLNILDGLQKNPLILELENKSWRMATLDQIQAFKNELFFFAPWLDTIGEMPDVLKNKVLTGQTDRLLNLLLKNKKINDLLDKKEEVLSHIDILHDLISKTDFNKNDEIDKGLLWLDNLKEIVESSQFSVYSLMNKINDLISRVNKLSMDTKFSPLFEGQRQLFSIGFNIEDNRLTNSYYDQLASESRQTSYIAIARGEVPVKHWFMLGRSLTVVDHYKGLVSWSGTMFEYLMPLLIMKNYSNTLLDETYSFVVRCQQKYAKERKMPWGVSESAYNSTDIHLDYQYKAIGVPWLGLKRGLIEDAVAAPYATFLALMVDPKKAYDNIVTLKKQGCEGKYGFYEAIDFTPERLGFDRKPVVIKSYMAHHQGMSLMALTNYLNHNIMQKRFSADAYIYAARLLLQERIPTDIVISKENKEKIMPFKGIIYHEDTLFRKFTEINTPLPMAHILSSDGYFVMVTDKGTGYSKSKSIAVSRWREDPIIDHHGMFFYVKNKTKNQIWSATYSPLEKTPDAYEVIFTPDKAVYKRKDDKIETTTEVIVTSADSAEIRRIKVKNNGDEACLMEITSYLEVVLATQESDLAHPSFGNLFVETEYHAEYHALLAKRRPRSVEDKSLWMAHMPIVEGKMVADIQYETDRSLFIGRGRTVTNPIILERDKPLSNTVGTVLDPILSIRLNLRVAPGKSTRISFVTMIADSKEAVMNLVEKYASLETCDASFWLAVARSEVELKYLNIKAHDMELYQDMIKDILYISPVRRINQQMISLNHKGQTSLWPYGISGDAPIVLVILEKTDEVEILFELLKAQEYWRIKALNVNLVVLVQEAHSYLNPLSSLVKEIVSDNQTSGVSNNLGDIFILITNKMADGDVDLIKTCARIIFKGNGVTMADQMKVKLPLFVEPFFEPSDEIIDIIPKMFVDDTNTDQNKLEFFNGIGGFSQNGQSYRIKLENNQTTPAPWSNIISNPKFGFMVTESGGGYTWGGNSRENKLTPWTNDAVSDSPSEVFYMRDEALNIWSLTPQPIREKEAYTIEHGFGYTEFKHTSHGIHQKLTQFVPIDDAVKISLIELKNEGEVVRNLSITYYAWPVLGVDPSVTGLHLKSSMLEQGTMIVDNPYNQEFLGQIMYMDVSKDDRTVTGNRHEFYGTDGPTAPEALKRTNLSGTLGAGFNTCMAMQINITLLPKETIKLVYVLGLAKDKDAVVKDATQYLDYDYALDALNRVKRFWREKLQVIQVNTPDSSMNLMTNGWLIYQVISCRLWSRTAFYQSGGAFGFRDQLQDSLSIVNIWPEVAKNQILKHAKHQFKEGDVLHWWHEPATKGVRTRISDDYLWLPYVTAEYIKITGDTLILNQQVAFVVDDILKPFEEERYISPTFSENTESLYNHCVLALENGLNFGINGLPLMGTGDWNDGMNTVGNKQTGESVWLAWFLYVTLQKFIPLCLNRGDEERGKAYQEICKGLIHAVETVAWDGDWYRRAFFDNGDILGSAKNSECMIDSLAQTWAVFSGAADPERSKRAMHSLEDFLIMKEEGLIKLLTPPFYDGVLEPGYIKGYVPGVRENGGQYTHAAAWVISAFAKQGHGDKAHEMFELINPINHTRTNHEVSIYKVEPYVMSADVYSSAPHIGRGGWTWYTGSASWMYKAGIEDILGFNKEGNKLIINPCIPKKWGGFQLKYKFEDTYYDIEILNPSHVSMGILSTRLDGLDLNENVISMIDDGLNHMVVITMG